MTGNKFYNYGWQLLLSMALLFSALFLCSCDDGDTKQEHSLVDAGLGSDSGADSGSDSGTNKDAGDDSGLGYDEVYCNDLNLTMRPFDPSGDVTDGEFGEIAGDLTFDTLDGLWNLKDNWTGCDNYVFVLKDAQIWASDVSQLIEDSPSNIHYFFVSMLSDGSESVVKADVTAISDKFNAYLKNKPKSVRDDWHLRLHFVTTPGKSIGWLGELSLQYNNKIHMIGIDRFQHVRDGGYPGRYIGGSWKEQVDHARYLGRYFDYESNLTDKLSKENDVFVYNVADKEDISDEVRTLNLGTADDLAAYDELKIELRANCPGDVGHPVATECGEWDTIGFVSVCSDKECKDGGKVVFKWITPYRQVGWWVADLSSLLGYFNHGDPVYLRINGGYSYKYTINLRFRNLGNDEASRAVAVLYDKTSARFDATYNEEFQTVDFTPPTGTTKVLFHGIVSGHGMSTGQNCAEFCTHQHKLNINGTVFETEYEMETGDGGNFGCAKRVGEGVSPNQSGTWVYDRAAWCPGWPVEPWVVDITDAVDLSGPNTAIWKGFYKNDFPPGNGGVINADMYLSFYSGSSLGTPAVAERDVELCTNSLKGTIRDFSIKHNDFALADLHDDAKGVKTGAVKKNLIQDTAFNWKPVYSWAGDADYGMTGPHYVPFTSGDSFDDWWRDVPGTNYETELQLNWTLSHEGTALLEQWSWYPLEPIFGFRAEGSWGYNDTKNNHYFTAEITYAFTYKGGEFLRFSSESDLWVFVNHQRVIDLGGGRHDYLDAVIDLDAKASSLGMTTGQTYDIHIFAADRNHTPRFTFELPDSCK